MSIATNERQLLAAVHAQDYEACARLLEAGANPNVVPEGDRFTAMAAAALRSDNQWLIQLLIDYGGDVNASNREDGGARLLHYLLNDCDGPTVRTLLRNGACVMIATNKTQRIPAHAVAAHGASWEVFRAVMAQCECGCRGLPRLMRDADGRTPLEVAAANQDSKLMSALANLMGCN